jgi:hypothetical protein
LTPHIGENAYTVGAERDRVLLRHGMGA